MDENRIVEAQLTNFIFLIREQYVLMDSDLSELYGVSTKRLNEQVKRNAKRFPEDFMFQLSETEWKDLKSRFATSSERDEKKSWGGRRTPPFMFTEQGVAMLSSVLNSPQAIEVNISIMRIFVKMRKWAINYGELLQKINDLQQSESEQNKHIARIYQIIEELLKPQLADRNPIGYNIKKGNS